MKKLLVVAIAATALFAAAFFVLSSEVYAQGATKHAPSGGKGGAKQDETVYVVQIGDEYKAIKKSDYRNEEKKLEEDYKQAIKEWQDSRKLDPKAPRPPKPIMKKKGTFQTDKVAQDFIDKLKEEDEKKAGGKEKKQ